MNWLVVAKLLDLYSQYAPLPPALVNLAGLIALQEKRYADAVEIFDNLAAGRPEDTVLRFNLAWAYFLQGDGDRAADLIDETVSRAAPQAAAIKIQALHLAGRLEEALDWGERLAMDLPDDKPLMGALAVVAMDLDKPELARGYGERAGSTVEGLSTLGSLELGDGRLDEAERMFDEALKTRQNSARALIGKGLVLMARNEPSVAAEWLHKGAGVFVDHLGSWIAAGWAEFAAGDYEQSRKTFEHALKLDDTFAESHGALAVLDAVAGDLVSAKRRADVALRLDKLCFSGMLASSLIKDGLGQAGAAQRIREKALNTTIDPSGRTLMQAITTLYFPPCPGVQRRLASVIALLTPVPGSDQRLTAEQVSSDAAVLPIVGFAIRSVEGRHMYAHGPKRSGVAFRHSRDYSPRPVQGVCVVALISRFPGIAGAQYGNCQHGQG